MANRMPALAVPEDGRFTIEQAMIRARPVGSMSTKLRLIFEPWRSPLDTSCMEYKVLDGYVYYLRLKQR